MRFTTRSCIKYLLFNLAESWASWERGVDQEADSFFLALRLSVCARTDRLRIDHVEDEIPAL